MVTVPPGITMFFLMLVEVRHPNGPMSAGKENHYASHYYNSHEEHSPPWFIAAEWEMAAMGAHDVLMHLLLVLERL